MNIEHLIYIVNVYKCGSINQAAKNCYISQSNLSNIIKNIENEIGYSLFFRTKSGLIATPAGEEFIISAEKIINERKIIQHIPDELSDNNSLALITSRTAFFTEIYFNFSLKFPSPIAHDILLSAGIIENIKGIVAQQGRIGLLCMFESRVANYIQIAEQYSLNFSILQENAPVCALLSKNHPLAKNKILNKNELNIYPFVVDAHIAPEDTLDILNIHNRNKVLFVSDRGSVFDAVRKGGFFSIGLNIPPDDAKMMNCVCLAIQDLEPMSICMIKLKHYSLSKRETQFVDYLRECLKFFIS